jgi:hypothetical protein
LAPQYIGQNEAVTYSNIDNSLNTLTPVKDKLLTDVVVEEYHKFFIAEQEWVSSATPTDFLEYQQVMYSTDGVTRPQKYKNGAYNNLGIVAPVTKPSLTQLNAAAAITDVEIENLVSSVGTYGDLPISDLVYILYNVKDGRYSEGYEIVVKASSISKVSVTKKQVRRASTTVLVVAQPDSGFDRSIKFSNIKAQFADSAVLFRYYKGVWRLVKTFATDAETFTDAVEDVSANDELDDDLVSAFDGTYQYVYTYYNENDGTESAPSPISSELELDSGTLQVTLPSTSPDSQVTHKRLYRVGGDTTEFTLVVQLDKDVTSFEDTLDATELDGRLLSSDNYYEAPTGLRYLTESYAMLFGALGNELRFTPIGVPNAWPPEYSIQFDTTVTGIGPVANGVIVFTTYKAYLVTGTGPLSLSQQSLNGDQGCIAHSSIQEIGPALIWASAEGLCMSSGDAVRNITKDKLGHVDLDPVDSVVADEVYYCHNADGSTLAFDFRFTPIPKYLDLGISTISYANGDLYGWLDGSMYKLFKSDDYLPFTYLSPRFIEGSVTELKTYKKIHIYSKGDIIINIIINDSVVATRALSGEGDYQLQIDQKLQRGNFIQFDIQGTGEVYEYEYIAGRERSE